MRRRTAFSIAIAAGLGLFAGALSLLRNEQPRKQSEAVADLTQLPGSAASSGDSSSPSAPLSSGPAKWPGDAKFRSAMNQLEVMSAGSREARRYISSLGSAVVPDILTEFKVIRVRQAQLAVSLAGAANPESEYARLETRKCQLVSLLSGLAGADVAPDLISVSKSSAPDSLVHQFVSVTLRKVGAWRAARNHAAEIFADQSSPSLLVREALSIYALDPTAEVALYALRLTKRPDDLVQDIAVRVAARAGKKEVLPQIQKLLETPRQDSRDLSALFALADLLPTEDFEREMTDLSTRRFERSQLRDAMSYNKFRWSDDQTRAQVAPSMLVSANQSLVIEGLRFMLEYGSEAELLANGILTRADSVSGLDSAAVGAIVVDPEWKETIAMSGYAVTPTGTGLQRRKL